MPSQEKVVAVIPARLQSSRLPRKVLADICGFPMLMHVYQRCLMASTLDEVVVATDSEEVFDLVVRKGGKAIMTSEQHETGTDRIAEASYQIDADIIINVQGDEALMHPQHVDAVVEGMKQHPEQQVALLVNPYDKPNNPSDIKVVLNEKNHIMYFSRADIPSNARTSTPPMWKAYHLVPFRKRFLQQFAQWPKGALEQIEFIEYMRILEKGHTIQAIPVESSAISVDTPEDLQWVCEQMPSDPIFQQYATRLESGFFKDL